MEDRFCFRLRHKCPKCGVETYSTVYVGRVFEDEPGGALEGLCYDSADPEGNNVPSCQCELDFMGKGEGYQFLFAEQCTGKKDKNDKLIFEGDIVGYDDGRRFFIRWGELEPIEEYCGFMIHPIISSGPGRSDEFPMVLYYGDLKTCEVIGNIHDNPELKAKLEAKKGEVK